MIKILFLEDHTSVRESIAFSLSKMDSSLQIIPAGTLEEAIETLSVDEEINTAIIDLSLKTSIQMTRGGQDGIAALSMFRQIRPDLVAIIYTMFSDAEIIKNCIAMGVQGYITKSSSIDELYTGIKSVLFGGSYFCREAMNILSKATRLATEERTEKPNYFSRYKSLTPKEKEIFIMTAKGANVASIADMTKKKESTIRNQRTAIYQKMGCADRHELFLAAQKLGLI